MYRLLSGYPPDKLLIIEVGEQSKPERRLRNVKYQHCRLPFQRLLTTRMHRFAETILAWWGRHFLSRVDSALGGFQPEAVLTIMHGYSWAKAHEVAMRLRIPLHCIVHDDWPRMRSSFGQSHIDRQFGRCYASSSTRFCVSQAMVEDYARRYGCAGSVMHPFRAAGVVSAENPPTRLQHEQPITVAFAGSVNGQGYIDALHHLATRLALRSGTLVIYGPLTTVDAKRCGLNLPNVTIGGLVRPTELVETLRRSADVLFVPMSFAPEDRVNMTLAFPSKLADCTLTGLPLLVYGPDYSSVIRFACENPGLAEVVSTDSDDELDRALQRLTEPRFRFELGEKALLIGNSFFSLSAAKSKFDAALCLTNCGE